MRGHFTGKGEGFDTRLNSRVKGLCVGGVDIAGKGEFLRIAALDEIKHNGTVPLANHLGEFTQVFGTSRRYRIRELSKAIFAHQMDIFYLNITT